jgi:MFS family permease
MKEPSPRRGNRLLLAQWLDLLEDESFQRYWLMRIASQGASSALSYALLVLTVRHSQSALATGALLLTLIVPSALMGAISGVAVDRLPRGLILLLSNLMRALLVVLLISAKDSLPGLYAVSLGFGIVTQFAVPAEGAVVPHVVRARRLVAANSFINLGTLLSQVLGMLVLAPVLLKTTNGNPLLFIIAGLYIFAAAIILLIPQFQFRAAGGVDVTLRAVRREFAQSWLRLGRDPTAFLALILLVVTSVSTLVIATLLPNFSTEILEIAPENIVFVLAPAGVGVFLGLRSVEFLSDRLNKLATISVAYLFMAASLIALGLVPGSAGVIESSDPLGLFSAGPLNNQFARILITVVYANFYGFSLTVVMTMGRVLLNERIPLQMQGRIFAAQSVLSNLAAIAPVVLAGIAADVVGVEVVLISAGVVALAAAAWSQARSSRVVPLAASSRG